MKKRNNRVLGEWRKSYCIILLVPLLATFISYSCNIKVIEEEIARANELVLNNLKNNIDARLKDEQEMIEYFYYNQTQKNIINASEKSVDFYEDIALLQAEINSYGRVGTYMLYTLNQIKLEHIMDSVTSHESANVYAAKKITNSNLPEYEVWMDFLNDEYKGEFLINNYLTCNDTNPWIVYAKSIYSTGKDRCNVFVSIPCSSIEKLTTYLENGTLLVINLSSETPNGEMSERETQLVLDRGGCISLPENWREDEAYVELKLASEIKGVSYSLMIPEEVFRSKSDYARNILLGCLVMTLVIGLALISYLSKQNFQPVSAIMKSIGKDDGTNEFLQIERAYEHIVNEGIGIRSRLEYQEDIMNRSRLLSMLKGRMLQNMDIDIGDADFFKPGGSFMLVGVYLPVPDKKVEDDELLFFIADNILTELLAEEQMKRTEDGRYLFYFFRFEGDDICARKNACLKQFQFLSDFFEDKLQLSLRVVLSAVETDISKMGKMYRNVCDAFEYQRVVGEENVIQVEDLFGDESDSRKEQLLYHTLLSDFLLHGKREDVGNIVEMLLKTAGNTSFAIIQMRFLDTYRIVTEEFEQCITDHEQRKVLLPFLESLLKADTIPVLCDRYTRFLSFAMEEIQRQTESDYQGLAEQVRSYIDRNYMDCGLNIGAIAEQLGKNPQHISRIFRECTGEGILDYLNRVRIGKAQILMTQSDRAIEKICEAVGYASVRTFRRAFVKVTGVMPSEYRGKRQI